MAHIQSFVANNRRMFKKTFSYYIMHISVAMLVGYFVTGSLTMAIALSLLEPTVQAFAFFFHEKIWERNQQKRDQQKNNPLPTMTTQSTEA
ncbi:DUF2061 domain-containing protein [Acinetobacter sp. 194]|uniref:DUF2061 domain-containing protein n=1 Tax=Acinetobacter shaoyimingii TaxID=2715164 RepID=UPI00140770A0|nr:DUF2061 domain-containing protein [Acinetobacter shaoyimingii]NHB56596.1 DUF2061 domain-containing protein [Acinetobacter shaoyimingii]